MVKSFGYKELHKCVTKLGFRPDTSNSSHIKYYHKDGKHGKESMKEVGYKHEPLTVEMFLGYSRAHRRIFGAPTGICSSNFLL